MQRHSIKQITKNSPLGKKGYKKLAKGISSEAKAKIKKIVDILKGDSSKLESIDELTKKNFGDLSKEESQAISSYILIEYARILKKEPPPSDDDTQGKQRQSFQIISNLSKIDHDIVKAVIRKVS